MGEGLIVKSAGLNIASYNCRGLPKTRNKLLLRPDILSIIEQNEIICFQETHYSKQNLKLLNGLYEGYIGIGAAKIDESDGIIQGRFSGGVALMWKSTISNCIKHIQLDVDWCVAIEVCTETSKFIIMNIYMPYQCPEHEDLYLEYLGFIKSFIDELHCTNFVIMGDFNANLRYSGNTIFADHLLEFCLDNELTISSRVYLPHDSYSYVGYREGIPHYSWLDHVVSSTDFHNCISNISIGYDICDEDHLPLSIHIDLNLLPSLSSTNNESTFKINWESATVDDLRKYLNLTDKKFSNIKLPVDAFTCGNLNCKDVHHKVMIEEFYNNITNVLYESSTHMCSRIGSSRNKPGWADYVADLYEYSRQIRSLWLDNGKPRQGFISHEFHRSKLKFKYALRFINRNENALRKESLAKKMTNLSSNDFWKEIKIINNSKTPLPCSIDNANSPEEITTLWENHFKNIFNCLNYIKSDRVYNLSSSYDSVKVHNSEIFEIIKSLELNKSCGMDGIQAEHLKYASSKLIPLLSMCLSSMFVHGFLPQTLMSIILVPIIKNKAGNVNSRDNYRPIALASVLSKLIEKVILNRTEHLLTTSHNQFGFKKKHGTDQCVYVLKEAISLYKSLNSCLTICFLDASKAFDRVSHDKLFKKLEDRGIPGYLLRIIVYWYEHQTMSVRWGSIISQSFTVSNGVRQGGILSPHFFNIYVDNLSERLNKYNIGCVLGNQLLNHLIYADDLVLISPSTYGLSMLLKECENLGVELDIKFNSSKSAIMFIQPNFMNNMKKPIFKINGETINVVSDYVYLGHIFQNDFSDDMDIKKQRRKLFAQGNSIMRKFYMCTLQVKLTLFQSYCSPMYLAHLWTNYKQTTISKLYTAYHNILKMFIGVSKREHTRPICAYLNVKYCPALIRNNIYKFMCRLLLSENVFIVNICESSIFHKSRIWKHWRSLLYTNGIG